MTTNAARAQVRRRSRHGEMDRRCSERTPPRRASAEANQGSRNGSAA